MFGYSARYDAALTLAARAHRYQTRKGSDIPYIVHPVQVSVILLRHGFAEDVLLAGLLHDVVEDQDVPLAQIEAGFGPSVAAAVAALTERKKEGDMPRPWRDRKQEALSQLRQASRAALAVKAADVTHNARTLTADLQRQGLALWEHYARGPEDTLWYMGQVAEIVRRGLQAHPLVREMEAAIEDLAQTIARTEAR